MPLICRKTLSNIWINFSNIAFPGSRIHVHVSTSSEAEGTINHRTKFGVCLGLFYLSINALIDLSINYSLKCSLCGKSKRKKIKRGVNSRDGQMCESDVKQQNWKYSIIRKEFYLILRQTPSSLLVKVPISSKLLFSHLIPYFMQWTSLKKKFDLDEKRIFYECLKTWKSYFLTVDPYRWSQHRHAQSCDVDSGTCEFRLDLSRLFYLRVNLAS